MHLIAFNGRLEEACESTTMIHYSEVWHASRLLLISSDEMKSQSRPIADRPTKYEH